MEHRLIKLFIINKWYRDCCHECDKFNSYSWRPKTQEAINRYKKHKCQRTSMKVGHRITFNIDVSYNPKEIAAINCSIDKYIVGSDNSASSLSKFYKQVKSKLKSNEEITGSGVTVCDNRQVAYVIIMKDNDKKKTKKVFKAVGSEFYFASATKPGKLVEWENYSINSEKSGIASSTSFDFIFTTNDTDIDAFEPHIDNFCEIGGYVCENEVAEIITKHIQQQKINKNKDDSFYTESLIDKIAKAKKIQADKIYANIEIDPSIKPSLQKHIQQRYIRPIAETMANAIIEFKIRNNVDFKEDKGCPHVGRKKKQKFFLLN